MKAIAVGKSLAISKKHSVEICSFLRGRTSEKGKMLLERVLTLKTAVPIKKFNRHVAHKPGKMAAGRYPINATEAILNLLKTAEANAEVKGLSQPLIIKEAIANQGSRGWHPGRQRRRKTKSTHIKITLESVEQKTPKIKETK